MVVGRGPQHVADKIRPALRWSPSPDGVGLRRICAGDKRRICAGGWGVRTPLLIDYSIAQLTDYSMTLLSIAQLIELFTNRFVYSAIAQ